jgi:hypothetical protein
MRYMSMRHTPEMHAREEHAYCCAQQIGMYMDRLWKHCLLFHRTQMERVTKYMIDIRQMQAPLANRNATYSQHL